MKKIMIFFFALIIIGCDSGNVTAPNTETEYYIISDLENSIIKSGYSNNRDNLIIIGYDQNIYPDSISISATLTNESFLLYVPFFDDGGFDQSSNDHIPKDGKFTALLPKNSIPEGSYKLNINAFHGNIEVSNIFDISFSNAKVPIIEFVSNLNNGDILESGFETIISSVKVIDEDNINGVDDTQDLKLEIIKDGSVFKSFNYTRENYEDDFIVEIMRDISSALETGEYTFKFTAKDDFDNISTPYILNITLVNGDPVIVSNNIPESIELEEGDNKTTFSVEISDGQTLSDIDKVEFKLHVSPTLYPMFDDGDPLRGDLIAGDGIYSEIFSFPYNVVTPGEYLYDIIATDKAGNITTSTYTLVIKDDE
ncbi:MAG: hypothetical protein CR982_00650 [Candidatus Cloacimonadota bacterium]|nr:MAG: hypothetical protein CR982_00650 [Candidatus Cloacimonadota bacterium]PIE78440.1 MAG: hypothetical protein CSA15_07825 [Candidatus Delongbacteria bacterium]